MNLEVGIFLIHTTQLKWQFMFIENPNLFYQLFTLLQNSFISPRIISIARHNCCYLLIAALIWHKATSMGDLVKFQLITL